MVVHIIHNCIVITCFFKLTVDLWPANCPTSTLTEFYNLLNDFNPKPKSCSTNGIVSATSSAPAAHVGQQSSSKGGNAVDAAITTWLS